MNDDKNLLTRRTLLLLAFAERLRVLPIKGLVGLLELCFSRPESARKTVTDRNPLQDLRDTGL
jgi:hypothetical protein